MDWLLRAPDDACRSTWLGEVLESMRPAFEARVRRFLAGSSLSRKMDLADLVQDANVRIVAGIAGFRGATWGEWLTWCRTIALNVALDAARRHHSEYPFDARPAAADSDGRPLDPPAPGRTPSSDAGHNERRELVDLAVESLEPDDRDLIRWRDFAQEDWPAIAARLGCTVDAARMRHKRALQRVAVVLEFLRGAP
jgi:RNA polymerase sigma factor (sigma-70 family)